MARKIAPARIYEIENCASAIQIGYAAALAGAALRLGQGANFRGDQRPCLFSRHLKRWGSSARAQHLDS